MSSIGAQNAVVFSANSRDYEHTHTLDTIDLPSYFLKLQLRYPATNYNVLTNVTDGDVVSR